MNTTDDWYTVSRLSNHSYSIDEGDGYGMFLVEGDERSVLIDAGAGVGDLRRLTTDLVDTPITLVLTHTHWDHIGAAAQFDDVLVSPIELPSDGRISIDSLSDEFTDRPTQFTKRWVEAGNELPDGVGPDDHTIESFGASEIPMEEGLDLGDRSLDVYPLPGHSPGHLGMLDSKSGIFYAGDIIHFDKGLYIMFEDCDIQEYIESLTTLKRLHDDGAFAVLATSHNEPLSGDNLSIIDDLLDGLREITAGERNYDVVDTDWGRAHSYQIASSEILTKTTV